MLSNRAQRMKERLKKISPIAAEADISVCRKAQDDLGKLMAMANARRGKLSYSDVPFKQFEAKLIEPPKPHSESILLYLHGGGYTAGGIDYATGFGSLLAENTELRVLCAAYRLAPEYRAPAPVEDALAAYKYLLTLDYAPEDIILAGESAGGGLCYALALKLKELSMQQPRAIAALSPWTDLACTGESFTKIVESDPSLHADELRYYVRLYAGEDTKNPLTSPLYGELAGLPPSCIIAGGDELLLSDSTRMADRLTASGCEAHLYVEPGMWHVYPLYRTPEADAAMAVLKAFIWDKAR